MEFFWKVVYKDGKEFSQYNANGSENLYKDINRKNIQRVVLCQVNNGKEVYVLHFTRPGQRLILRRKTERAFGSTPTGGIDINQPKGIIVVWLIGMQWNVGGRNVKKLAWVFPDGRIEEGDDFVIPSHFKEPILLDLEDKLDGIV